MFFETEQPTRPWMDAKETAKLLAWNRQELISNELSRLAADEYLEDIMLHLRHMEVCDLPLGAPACWLSTRELPFITFSSPCLETFA